MIDVDIRTREEIYHDEIEAHVSAILEICRESGIGLICSFAIPTDNEPHLCVTTALIGGPVVKTDRLIVAYHVLVNECTPELRESTRRMES